MDIIIGTVRNNAWATIICEKVNNDFRKKYAELNEDVLVAVGNEIYLIDGLVSQVEYFRELVGETFTSLCNWIGDK